MRRFKDESSLVVIFYASLIGGVLLGVLAAVTWPSEGDVVQAVLDDPWPFAIAVGMGNFLPNFLGMVGATFADASVQAVAGQSAVVFAFLMVRIFSPLVRRIPFSGEWGREVQLAHEKSQGHPWYQRTRIILYSWADCRGRHPHLLKFPVSLTMYCP